MNERLNAMLKSEPSLGIAKRASFLVVVGGPRNRALSKEVNRIPLANVVLAGTITGFRAGSTAVPQVALENAVEQSLGGPPTNAEQVGEHRKALLAGNAGLIAAGFLAQRAINHSSHGGPVAQLGQILASQLTIGAAAASIILVSDAVLGPLARRRDQSSPATMAVQALTLRAQVKALRRATTLLTPPTKPTPHSYVG